MSTGPSCTVTLTPAPKRPTRGPRVVAALRILTPCGATTTPAVPRGVASWVGVAAGVAVAVGARVG
ncbi:MAG: hypothetical protein IPM84_26740 [Anaerolineae bacterium]|nr:hypothetical protein [Anaerolineae bacterium]